MLSVVEAGVKSVSSNGLLLALASAVPAVVGLALLRRWGVDKPCDTDGMPDAPAPTYSDSGRPLGDWSVSVHYDSVRDDLVVTWQASATPWKRSLHGQRRFAGPDLEDALKEADYRSRVLGVRRLF